MRRGLIGLQTIILLLSLVSMVAFLTMRDELRGIVYQLPRVASSYRPKLQRICEEGQDEEYVTLPAPPPGVVILMDNCDSINKKSITRTSIKVAYTVAAILDVRNSIKNLGVVKEAATGLTLWQSVEGIRRVATVVRTVWPVAVPITRGVVWSIAMQFDPNPDEILSQYEAAVEDTSLVFARILNEGSSVIRVPVGVDETIIVSSYTSSAADLEDDTAVLAAGKAQSSMLANYKTLNSLLTTLFLSFNDKPYADAHFVELGSMSHTFVEIDGEVTLRPDHAKRLFNDFARNAKDICDESVSEADRDHPEYQTLFSRCQTLEDALDDRTLLLKDQDIVLAADNLDPWKNVTAYISDVVPLMEEACEAQKTVLGEGWDESSRKNLCNYESFVSSKVRSIQSELADASDNLRTMKAARGSVKSVLNKDFVTKKDEASTQGVDVEAVNVTQGIVEGRCVGTEIDLHDDDGNVLTNLRIPFCAFQISCQEDDLTTMGYEESCMAQLINIKDEKYPLGGDLVSIDAMPADKLDLSTAQILGGYFGRIATGFARGFESAFAGFSAIPLYGQNCGGGGDAKKKLVFCLEAEEGCLAADVNCRFCYTFSCNVPVYTTPQPRFGISMQHTGDELLVKGNFLPM